MAGVMKFAAGAERFGKMLVVVEGAGGKDSHLPIVPIRAKGHIKSCEVWGERNIGGSIRTSPHLFWVHSVLSLCLCLLCQVGHD